MPAVPTASAATRSVSRRQRRSHWREAFAAAECASKLPVVSKRNAVPLNEHVGAFQGVQICSQPICRGTWRPRWSWSIAAPGFGRKRLMVGIPSRWRAACVHLASSSGEGDSTCLPLTYALPSRTSISIEPNRPSQMYRSTPSVASGKSPCGLVSRRLKTSGSNGAFMAMVRRPRRDVPTN
jgi:hypothetical protein